MHNSTIGMAMIPEEPSYDSNAGTPTGYNYNHGAMNTGLYDAQVYSLTSLPEPDLDLPTFDSSILSQKSHSDTPFHSDSKDAPTSIEWMPSTTTKEMPTPIEPHENVDAVEIDESDPVYALYADHPATPAAAAVASGERIFGAIPVEKALERLEMVAFVPCGCDVEAEESVIDAATLERFQRLCGSIESSFVRVAGVTGHL